MVSSPLLGLVVGMLVMTLLYWMVGRMRPRHVSGVFGKLQLVSAGYMGFAHGSNDAQKTMGVICLALVAATKNGVFEHAPRWMHFMATADGGKNQEIPLWIKVVCALVMALGTAAGGWRIIKTIGKDFVKLQPVHGFCVESTSAAVILGAASIGMPVSTTHIITSSILGVGLSKRLTAVNWNVAYRILWAWILTIPASAIVAFITYVTLSPFLGQ
jgi:PiT family inorganic phosphate transporter